LLTPILPNVFVLPTSGRMHARSLRCTGSRIQSSQYERGLKQNRYVGWHELTHSIISFLDRPTWSTWGG
jgi:hypothetical protein